MPRAKRGFVTQRVTEITVVSSFSTRARTLLRTNPISGPVMRWAWGRYITALCTSSPDDCAEIPKVAGAGRVFRDAARASASHQRMHNGVKVRVGTFCGDFTTRLVERLRGHHEPQQERVFHEVLKGLPDDLTMMEVGSNWAYYSLWAKHARPAARTILIEPVDAHMEAGKDNFALNGVHGEFVRAYVAAESRAPHDVTLEGVRVRDIPALSIDDAVARCHVPFLHILHADIQGAELDLLRGSLGVIRDARVGYVFLSTHCGRLHARCLDFLVERGFVVVAAHTKRESVSTDGLIVARHPAFAGLDRVEIHRNTPGEELRMLWRHLWTRPAPRRPWRSRLRGGLPPLARLPQ